MSSTRPRPLFVTGTARSGSTLLARMLAANPRIMVASDPYFPMFRSLRNAIVRRAMRDHPGLVFDPASPFQDYYFTRERLELMDAVLEGDLDVPFESTDWPALADAIRARAAHECPDIVPLVGEIEDRTYRAMMERALAIITAARACADRAWVGVKEVWIVELFRPLAKAFPDAKFIVLLRHPAATVNSDLAARRSNPSGVGHPLSTARQWRKQLAFGLHYGADPALASRCLVVTYERILHEPERSARELSAFLGVEYDPAMVDTESYVDFKTGRTWKGNSSFTERVAGIDRTFADRWRETLEPAVADMIEYTCGPDMRLAGYETAVAGREDVQASAALRAIVEHDRTEWDWRTDLGDPQEDLGAEMFRRLLLDAPATCADPALVRRSFLFEDVYAKLRTRGRAS